MKTQFRVNHEQRVLKTTYEQFIANFEKVLNRLNPDWSKDLQKDPEGVRRRLKEVAGDTGLMIVGSQQYGELLNLYGKQNKAIQYTIGNPLTALEMTKYDVRAGLYAPARMIVYQGDDDKLYVVYDIPSSLFAQYGNEIYVIAKELDRKLENVIQQADQLAF